VGYNLVADNTGLPSFV